MRAAIYTLGCKVNTYESEYVTELLKDNNIDVIVINTCTVTNNSDAKSRKIIREARRNNPNAIIVAMGCFIEANKDKVLEDVSEIDIAIGNKNKSKLLDYINDFKSNKNKVNYALSLKPDKFEDMFIKTFTTRTRAFVKVQDGCENFCSYCLIPLVRGKCRSKDLDVCIDEIKCLVNKGYKEIVLTGIHTGNYGVDINTNFATLLKEIVKIEGLERLRISSIEATELTDEVLEVIKNNDKIVNHFHVPIQSGSNKVLKLMNRKYDIELFIDKINKLRDIKKDVSITTDIITGHPGEDEEAFNETLENLKKIKFSKLHVFPYSIRKNTPSSRLEQIPDIIKKDQTNRLLELSKSLEIEYMSKFIDKELSVLIETSKDGYSYGHTTNYLSVKIKGEYEHNTIVNTKLIEIEYPNIIGKVI